MSKKSKNKNELVASTIKDLSSYIYYRNLLKQTPDHRWCVNDQNTLPAGEEILNWLYQLLTVLDAKASALMRLNGVMLAATSFLLNPTYHSSDFIKSIIAASGISSAVSIGLCLFVVAVSWPFLGRVKHNEDEKKVDFSYEFASLQNTANFRQRLYQIAWVLSLLAIVLFLSAIISFLYKFMI